MRNEFKSIKAYKRTWCKLDYVRDFMRCMGYRLTKSECLDLGINLILKGCKSHLEKIKKEDDVK
ncbi:hypothetical protein EFA69_14620 [Rufibacter immobilis]|uniref:Uncharacterized protein n=1 Tax=Rufibacter immobilis TaxID=1348778 RepID=A0A3M9MPA7_9BACT|nr:hypothetical protein EFA69_14620 [Rufibacter immobilis]